MTCQEEDLAHIEGCVNSLMDSVLAPEEIVITTLDIVDRKLNGPDRFVRRPGKYFKLPGDSETCHAKIPSSLMHREHIHIHAHQGPHHHGLTALTSLMKRYPYSDDLYVVYLDGNCVYPVHLISEYVQSLVELQKVIADKLPASKGSVLGIAGVVMAEDKKRSLEKEFQSLIDGTEEFYEKRTILSYVKDNATVDYLESMGSIIMHRSQLEDDFPIYLNKVWTDKVVLSTDVILNNYFASKNIVRVQICNMLINRYMMEHMKCFAENQSLETMSKQEKSTVYENTISHLRSIGCFCVY